MPTSLGWKVEREIENVSLLKRYINFRATAYISDPNWIYTTLLSALVLLFLFAPQNKYQEGNLNKFNALLGLCSLCIALSHYFKILLSEVSITIFGEKVIFPLLTDMSQFVRVIFTISGYLSGTAMSPDQTFWGACVKSITLTRRYAAALAVLFSVEFFSSGLPLRCAVEIPFYLFVNRVTYECLPNVEPGLWTMPITLAAPFVICMCKRRPAIAWIIWALSVLWRFYWIHIEYPAQHYFRSGLVGSRRFELIDTPLGRIDDYVVGFYFARLFINSRGLPTLFLGAVLWGFSLSLFCWARRGNPGYSIAASIIH